MVDSKYMMKNIVCAPKYFKIILINLNGQRQTLLIIEDIKTGPKYCGRLINVPPKKKLSIP